MKRALISTSPDLVATPAPARRTAQEPVRFSPAEINWRADASNPIRQIGFICAVVFVFLRVSFLHEYITYWLGSRPYLLITVAIPTIVAMLVSGGIRRTFATRIPLYWLGFIFLLGLSTIFSSWKGGSLADFQVYLRAEFIYLFVVAGLTFTWRECRVMMYTVAFAGLTSVVMGRVFKNGGDERLDLGFGRIGNANDFAAHLLFVLPFVAFLVLQGRSWFIRLISVGSIAYGVYLIAATGSRGALLAFLVGFLFLMLRAPTRFRIVAGLATPLLILLTLLVLPRAVLKRYSTLYSSENTDLNGGEAEASKERRTQLFRTSLRFTVEHPVLGVGMGQFASFEGGSARQISRRGMWQETHNTYTQVSSEDGIPALLFFLAALGSTYLLLSKNYRRAFYDKRLYEFRSMTFCMMLAMVCYASAVIFLSQAYTFYFPLVSGLAIAINSVLQRELANLPPPPHAARS